MARSRKSKRSASKKSRKSGSRKRSPAKAGQSWCVKCRKFTASAGPTKVVLTKNKRHMQVTACAACGTKKCKFIKG